MAADTTTDGIVGRDLATCQAVTVRFADGLIASIKRAPESDALPWIGPGLVDLQVNGFAGLDLNDGNLTTDTVARLTRKIWLNGVTSYLPTLVTASESAIDERLRAIAKAVESNPEIASSIAGIHLEGPFISPEDGPRGAHDSAHVGPPDWSLFERWQSAADGLIKIVTLAPEWPEALDFIARCRASGVTVAIGHTAATPERIREAVAAGARLSTHLGNGAHATLARHPNYIWEQLANDDLWASMIADGFHLPDAVLKVFLRVKGERAILVSDSVGLAGLESGRYTGAIGQDVVLTLEGRLHLASDPRLLAGSAQSLLDGIAHLVGAGLTSLAGAWDLASTRPAEFLGLDQESGLVEGGPADLVAFRWDGRSVAVEKVLKSGKLVHSNARVGLQGAAR